jgi:hypothetical protein
VTRSIAGRQRHARLVAVSAGIVAVVAAAALAGCGAGQIAETSTIVAAVPGGMASIAVPTEDNPNGALLINNVTIDYNDITGYPAGATAPLSMWIINQSTEPVVVTAGGAALVDPTKATTLTPLGSMSLSGGSADVQALEGVAGVPSSAPSAVPPSPPSEAPSSPTESGAPSPGATDSTAPSAPPAAASITIQPGTMRVLSMSAGSGVQHLELAKLKGAIVPGNTVQLTFNVTKQDGTPLQSAQIVAPIAPPSAPAPRVTDSGFPPSPNATS